MPRCKKIGYNFKLQKPLNQRGGGTSLSSITTVLLSTKLEHYGTYIVLVFVFYFLSVVVVGFSHYFSETTRISSASPRKSSSVSSKSAKNCGYGVVVILVFVFIVVLLIIIYCCCCILMEFRRKKGRNLFSVFLRRFTNKSHRHVTDTVIKVGGTSIPTESEVIKATYIEVPRLRKIEE